MGKIVEKKRKKKKGRPSLLDLQKRSLKQQKQLLKKHNKNLLFPQKNNINIINNNANSSDKITKSAPPSPEEEIGSLDSAVRRSTRRNPNPNFEEGGKKKNVRVLITAEDGGGGGDGEESENVGNDDFAPGEFEERRRNLRKRKIDSVSGGSGEVDLIDDDDELQVEKQSVAVTDPTNVEQASDKQDDGSFTPLPDKKLLLFILERLQKKDTYGVFAEPVDPDELPDYHEIIEHPMDFSTVRKKLEDGAYGNLEEFEKDIYLICSNAMQYNAPDTVYFRQACTIQELATKNFDNLRQDSDDNNEQDPEPRVARRGRPPKNLKRRPGRPPLVRANSDFSETVPPTAGGTTGRSSNDPKKGSPVSEKHGFTDSFARKLLGARNSEGSVGRLTERFDRSDDMIGSSSKGSAMKYGKRQIILDENRRNTYKHPNPSASRQEPSVLTTFQRERKQLIAVGLHTQYGYARSLARFAAKLGPVAWKVASRKIERCLPSTVKFGQGWVGENEAPLEKKPEQLPDASRQSSTPVTMPASAGASVDSGGGEEQKPQREHLPEMRTSAVATKLNDDSDKATSTSVLSNGSASVGQSSLVNMVSNSVGSIKSANSIQIHQTPTIRSHINGVNGNYEVKFTPEMGKTIAPTKTEAQSSNGCGDNKLAVTNSTAIKASDGSVPPDLNVGFHSPGSPGSGKVDSAVQTDLALQL